MPTQTRTHELFALLRMAEFMGDTLQNVAPEDASLQEACEALREQIQRALAAEKADARVRH